MSWGGRRALKAPGYITLVNTKLSRKKTRMVKTIPQ
jgi:hypothetical protein